MTVAKDNIVAVKLAGQDFLMKRVPMARIKRLSKVIASFAMDKTQLEFEKNPEQAVNTVLDKLLDFPHELMSVFIDKLPKDIFEDEENGVTFPELYDALLAAVELNRLDALKNVLANIAPLMQAVSK